MKGGNTAMSIMPIERIPDWEKRLARHDAFWAREIIDRPFVSMIVPNPNPDFPLPATRGWASHRERWMDAEYQAELALARVMNRDYLGDALPGVFPNLGPEIFSAFFGTELEYGETTSWSVPNLADWATDPADNFGWIVLGNESVVNYTDPDTGQLVEQSSKRGFASFDHEITALRRVLTVTFDAPSTLVPEPSTLLLGLIGAIGVGATVWRTRKRRCRGAI